MLSTFIFFLSSQRGLPKKASSLAPPQGQGATQRMMSEMRKDVAPRPGVLRSSVGAFWTVLGAFAAFWGCQFSGEATKVQGHPFFFFCQFSLLGEF